MDKSKRECVHFPIEQILVNFTFPFDMESLSSLRLGKGQQMKSLQFTKVCGFQSSVCRFFPPAVCMFESFDKET